MIKFGPSGFCEEFSINNKSTEEMPKWLLNHNLNCYEISFTNGVRLSLETAEKYGKLFKEADIEISVHAPYYINFANPDPLMIEKSNGYIIESLKRMEKLLQFQKVFKSICQNFNIFKHTLKIKSLECVFYFGSTIFE